jgi:hypothetical protein
MIILVIILCALVAILSYLVYINFRKAEMAVEYCQVYLRFVTSLYVRFKQTKDRMDEVDRLGSFKADDETGFAFDEMNQSIKELYEFITKYVDRKEEKTEKAKD